MYSEVMKPAAKYAVTKIDVNGKPLQSKDFTPQQWDKIILPLQFNNDQQQWNSYVYKNVARVFLRANDSSVYVNNYGTVQFQKWYHSYLESLLHTKINSLNTTAATCVFINNTQP